MCNYGKLRKVKVKNKIRRSKMGHACLSVTFDLYRLNEGHTVFVERKITGRLHKSQALLEFMAAGRAKELKETIVNSHAINN